MIDRYGNPGGSVAMLVHGASVNRKAMLPLAQALAPRTEVLVPDLPGHGARSGAGFSVSAAADELIALVATCAGRRVVLAGDSLGGYVVLAAAARCGRRLAGVVAGGCSFPMHGAYSLAAKLTDVPLSLATRVAGERAVEGLLLRAFTALGGDDATCDGIAAAGIRLAARGESIRALREVRLAPLLAAIDVPVVLVNGARDVPIVWCAPHYARLARDGRAVAIAGGGHGVMSVRPQPVGRAILALLRADADANAPAV